MKNFFEFILSPFFKKRPTVPVLRFDGVIGTGGGLGKGRINAENLEINIKKAFSTSKPSAVAIIINSPGGSPVQSSLIYQRVRYFKFFNYQTHLFSFFNFIGKVTKNYQIVIFIFFTY